MKFDFFLCLPFRRRRVRLWLQQRPRTRPGCLRPSCASRQRPWPRIATSSCGPWPRKGASSCCEACNTRTFPRASPRPSPRNRTSSREASTCRPRWWRMSASSWPWPRACGFGTGCSPSSWKWGENSAKKEEEKRCLLGQKEKRKQMGRVNEREEVVWGGGEGLMLLLQTNPNPVAKDQDEILSPFFCHRCWC